MTEDWFRLPDWDDEARAEFERRLSRSGPQNRAQYMRIKGLAIAGAGEVEGTRELWQRVLEHDGEFASLHAKSAAEDLGDSFAEDDPDLAIKYYRQSLTGDPHGRSFNGTTAMQYVKIAELLLRRRGKSGLAEAADLLSRWPDDARLPFPNAHF